MRTRTLSRSDHVSKESIVEIPSGSGNKYRYAYDPETQATRYLGPVGSAPDLGEAEFMMSVHVLTKAQDKEVIFYEKVASLFGASVIEYSVEKTKRVQYLPFKMSKTGKVEDRWKTIRFDFPYPKMLKVYESDPVFGVDRMTFLSGMARSPLLRRRNGTCCLIRRGSQRWIPGAWILIEIGI